MRILIIEDEALLAMMLTDMLEDLQHEVVGVAARLSEAMEMASSLQFDLAVMDLNLGGERTYPVAAALTERKVPFIFSTGYGAESLNSQYASAPILMKPFQPIDLENALAKAVAQNGN